MLLYDQLGRITYADSGYDRDYIQRHYTYDARNRLASYSDVHTYADSVQEDCPDHQIICDPPPPWDLTWHNVTLRSATYSPDYSGNRTDGSASLSNDRLSSMTGADGRGYSFTYDNAGRVLSKTATGYVQTYGWNALGELSWVKTAAATTDSVAFSYDVQGRRVRKWDSGTSATTYYVWDGNQLLMQLDGSGNRTFEHSYQAGIDAPVAVKASGSTMYYYQLDQSGNVAAVWNTSNSIVARYTYDPYGYTVASSGSVTQPLRWKGREYDSETGLYYVRARYYDPTVGRFISEDPIGLAGGINPYAYADGEPVNRADPSGLASGCTWVREAKVTAGSLNGGPGTTTTSPGYWDCPDPPDVPWGAQPYTPSPGGAAWAVPPGLVPDMTHVADRADQEAALQRSTLCEGALINTVTTGLTTTMGASKLAPLARAGVTFLRSSLNTVASFGTRQFPKATSIQNASEFNLLQAAQQFAVPKAASPTFFNMTSLWSLVPGYGLARSVPATAVACLR